MVGHVARLRIELKGVLLCVQVERSIDLVDGGGSVGLMGLVSRAVHSGGGHVLGIVPKAVLPRELIGDTPGELKDVSGMHQRKAEMARNSDAFIALPGTLYAACLRWIGLDWILASSSCCCCWWWM